ncbi:hypothetical protein ACQ4PT_033461 [Festuca glaucescens]
MVRKAAEKVRKSAEELLPTVVFLYIWGGGAGVGEWTERRRRWNLSQQEEVVKQSRLLDDHPEQDSLREFHFPARLPSPPQPQADSDVSEAFVKIVEDFMKGVSDYGASESEQPPTIYKVPEEMKNSHKEAYNPIVVWIGLFNGDNETRRHGVIRGYKWCCMRKLISRHHLLQEPERMPVLLRRCLEALEGVLPRIISSNVPRHHQVRYDHGLRQSILSIMLRDGCFILHRLIKYARIARREPANPTGSGASDNMVWGFVTCNLLLLENQIPFFVVQKLFQQLRTDPDESSDVLVASALRLFRSLRPRKLHSSAITGHDVHHLLHLFYLSVGLPEEAVPATHDDARRHAAPLSELPQWIPSARELEEAGVKFRSRKDAKSFLDVRFHGGVLEIPELELYDYSEPLFRNLIAFEQTYPFTPGHVTAYAIFMDCLVTSPEDMRLLHLSGVLVNQMNGERDAAGFFGRLCAEAHLASNHNYLAGVILEINRYQRSPRWRAALVRNYFSNPWVVMSLFAAIFLLTLTMMQSFFAAYSYFKPPKQQ